MALLEGDERSQMPSMSWSSVVRDRPSDVADRESVTATQEAGATEADVHTAPPAPIAAASPVVAVAFSTPPLTATPPPVGPTPLVPPPGPSTDMPAAPPLPEVRPVVGALSVPDFDDLLDHTSQPIATSTAPTIPIVARVPGATLTGGLTEALPVTPTGPPAAEPLPEIVEATPSSSVTSQIAVIGAPPTTSSTTIQPVVDHASTPAPTIPDPVAVSATPVGAPVEVAATASAPVADDGQLFQPAPSLIPSTQPNQALSLPPVVAPRPPAGELFQPTPVVRPQRKDRSGSIARIGFFFLIVATLGSAAVIFGRPFLFPADWEAAALEFAEPIEAARGVEFV
ncbi:MAG: hypothetical protein ABJ382_20335, partial [Ilumatobacter sp.]